MRTDVSRRPLTWATAALGLVWVVHLIAQGFGSRAVAAPTQVLLMPLLAAVLVIASRAPRDRLTRVVLVALAFSWLGDTAPRLLTGDDAFLAMVGFFLLAQIAYVVAFLPQRRSSVLTSGSWRWPLPLLGYTAGFAGLVVACAPHAGGLLVPVVVYGLCLTLMAVLATGVHRLAGIGGAVFFVSDALIALGAFLPGWSLPGHDVWVMLTYVAGQGLVVAGVLGRRRAVEDEPVVPASAVSSAG